MLEDIEEDSLSVTRTSHLENMRGPQMGTPQRTSRPLPRSATSSLNASQTSVRPLPPVPKTGAFETVVPSPETKVDNAGVVVTPVEVTTKKSGCSCLPFFWRGSKSQVAPMCQTNSNTIADFSSKVRKD